ncbi:MAG TPA: glycosyltransferase, partial [Saprospiraceae bacterium]|nr:glycosyltransferase [Saprospiraceae bacterium]
MNQITIGLIFLGCAAAAGYALLCFWVVRNWRRLPEWTVPEAFVPHTSVSVVIPARNEAAGIEACLRSVFQQNYPPHLLEIIVVDDHSEDDTVAIVGSLNLPNLRLLRLADFVQPGATTSFKKKAIKTAIAHARGELIVTTDADCTAPPDWLPAIVSLYEQRRPKAILASVGLAPAANKMERFQALDMAGLMLCSGA